MLRRTFLKWQMQGAFLAASGALFTLPELQAMEKPVVAVCKGTPASATRAAVMALGGMSRFVRPGQSVVIKPNMSFAATPETALNTNPEVVREVVRLCLEAKAGKILVLDHPLEDATSCLQRSGILKACTAEIPNICYQREAPSFFVETHLSKALEMNSCHILREVLEAQVLISVPVAKSHAATGVSMGLKGQMGLVLDRQIMHSRYNLHHAIVDLNSRIPPQLTIIDATRILLTGGPAGPGSLVTPHEVIASHDPVAADATGIRLYPWHNTGLMPEDVLHVRHAHERGLGRMDIENLYVLRTKAKNVPGIVKLPTQPLP